MTGQIGKYVLIKTLGEGATCKVKLAQNQETGEKVALKIIKKNIDKSYSEYLITEIQAMSVLDNQNVIKQLEYGRAQYNKPNGKSREVFFIVIELAKGGNLMDLLMITGGFTEKMARFFFK